MSESFFHKLIDLPTRVITDKSSSLIDNIYTNTPNCHATGESVVLEITITDYYHICTILHNQFSIIKRELTKQNISSFRKHLKKINLNSNNNPIIFSEFYETITAIFNTCFPLKEIVPKYDNTLPWITTGLKNQ